jgi:glycosyltransferase involved in cell wall biosynthesis
MSSAKKAKIGFSFLGGQHWIAGVTFLESILKAVKSLDESERPEVALLFNKAPHEKQLASLRPYIDEILQLPAAKPPTQLPVWHQRYRSLKHKLRLPVHPLAPDLVLEPFLKEHGITAFFAKNECEKLVDIPLISWIPDFQHEHLPELFSSQEMKSRRQHFARVTKFAARIAVTSVDVQNDLKQYLPSAKDKAMVIPFVTSVPADCLQKDPSYICNQYQIPEKYLYLPNQFFKHKNHMTVIKALEIAAKENPEVTVVCSGNTQDHRQPTYFNEILQEISAGGVRPNFIILGLIPYEHVFALMRQSLAVLQPSNFEGLSMSLAEARSIGKRVILSDLNVHKEMAPEWALFFNRTNEHELAQCMLQTYSDAKPGPDRELEALMKERNPKRIQDFGRAFMNVVLDPLKSRV